MTITVNRVTAVYLLMVLTVAPLLCNFSWCTNSDYCVNFLSYVFPSDMEKISFSARYQGIYNVNSTVISVGSVSASLASAYPFFVKM